MQLLKKTGEENLIPLPPYSSGRQYESYPKSFEPIGFNDVVIEFNKLFKDLNIPLEVVKLRNAMAHGNITQIDHSKLHSLLKFNKKRNDKELTIEFSIELEPQRVSIIKQSVVNYRRFILKEIEKI